MMHIIFPFFEEILLIAYILGGIIVSSFIRHKQKTIQDLFKIKRAFYLLCRVTFGVLLLCLVYSLVSFSSNYNLASVCYDSLSTPAFYNVINYQPFSTAFFRKDLVTEFFNVVLNLLVLFYLYLVYESNKITTETSRYLLEIPVLLVTIFLSLKLFLYTYDLILIVITLELTAFCSVVLISLQLQAPTRVTFPLEAAVKYFIFNALAISFFLFATCSYYSFFKSVNLFDFGLFYILEPGFYFEHLETLLLTHLLFFGAYLMKLGAAPFHQWVPDVYEGSELLITAFLVLIIGPALNLKLFTLIKLLLPLGETNSILFSFFLLAGFSSIIVGSFQAFSQTRIKRFLAYTGITHLGYILVSLGTATFFGFFAGLFYLLSYIVTNCIFFSLLIISRRLSGLSLIYLNHLKLLFNDNVVFFLFFFIPLLSFAGFPPFAGFFSKFFALASLVDQQHIFFVILLLGYVLISAYLYLRFIKIALFEKITISFYLPLLQKDPAATVTYYKFENTARPAKLIEGALRHHNVLLCILFGLNMLLIAFLGFLPLVSIALQQPLIALFLFY